MNPLLIDVPERLDTPRWILRCPRAGDGPKLSEAVCASVDELKPWMIWAQTPPTIEESELVARRGLAQFILREDLAMFIFERTEHGSEGRIVGGAGLHRMDWAVRRFEMGYWRRTGFERRGVVSEAVAALTAMAFDVLAARRLEIRMDDDNRRSRTVAERAGYRGEGVLRNESITPDGRIRSTRVYALCADEFTSARNGPPRR